MTSNCIYLVEDMDISNIERSEIENLNFPFIKNEEKPVLEVSSNWKTEISKDINSCLSLLPESEIIDKIDVEDVVSYEKCICMETEDCEEFCKIKCKFETSHQISRLAIVSESSILEFYKELEEYTATVYSEFIDEFEGNTVYFAEISFPPGVTECTIKFVRTKNRCSMWIYGIKIFYNPHFYNSGNIFNLTTLRQDNTKMNKNRFDQIELTKNVLETLNISKNMSKENITSLLYAMMKEPASKGPNTQKNNLSGTINSENSIESNIQSTSSDTSRDLMHINYFKMYIDHKLENMEKRLMQRLELIENKTDERFDTIIRLLEKKGEKK